ncbi:hypothetical protein ACH50O_21715 [Methylomonas sp. 2BW1-5-20]|uniref:hypothetical protein n=1 Tax=Methylomonas sp. 2BW1-5-20 TaxID=3376686 RepID=UPI0040529AAC
MNTFNPHRFKVLFLLATAGFAYLLPAAAKAALLNASSGGTFTMNMDREAMAAFIGGNSSNPGHFLVHYYDTQESDYLTRSDSSFYLGNSSRTEIPAQNLVHDITPISASNPGGQAPNRYVKSTSPDFAIDSQTLAGTGVMGMTGVELYRGRYGGSLIYGDYTLQYNPDMRQEVWDFFGINGTPGGWYLQNNISFPAAVYELDHLNLIYTNADNWQLSGDLLLTPENAGLVQGVRLTDVGDFCLGVGSYAGCGQISSVPLPGAAWLFVGGLPMLLRKRVGVPS